MDHVLNQLQMLTEKFKQKKRLNNEESNTAREQLEQFLTNPEYLAQAFKLISYLPPEVSCQALLAAWKAGDREHREKLVKNLLEDRELADREDFKREQSLKLSLTKEFITADSQVALRLLIDVADRLTEGGRKPPARQLASQFRRELMDTKKLLDIPLGESNVSSRDISGIAGMVLMGMIEDRDTCAAMDDTGWKYDFLDWFGGYKSKVTLGGELVSKAEKVTKNWPEDLQRKCVALGLITMVQTQFTRKQQIESYLRPEHGREVTAASPEIERSQIKECSHRASAFGEGGLDSIQTAPVAQRESRDGLCMGLNSKLCLEWLAEYVNSIEKKNEVLSKDIKFLEGQFHLEQKHRIDLERHIAELQAELQHQRALLHEKNEKISMLERETRELQSSLHNEKYAREEEVKHLKERIDRECNYVIEDFKGKL
jgi:hypothetical protein